MQPIPHEAQSNECVIAITREYFHHFHYQDSFITSFKTHEL
jgi:hypothetical protein